MAAGAIPARVAKQKELRMSINVKKPPHKKGVVKPVGEPASRWWERKKLATGSYGTNVILLTIKNGVDEDIEVQHVFASEELAKIYLYVYAAANWNLCSYDKYGEDYDGEGDHEHIDSLPADREERLDVFFDEVNDTGLTYELTSLDFITEYTPTTAQLTGKKVKKPAKIKKF